jgi:hypothetical protein
MAVLLAYLVSLLVILVRESNSNQVLKCAMPLKNDQLDRDSKYTEYGHMAPELQWARFLKNLKTVSKSFQKFEIKIPDVDNNKIY